MPTISLCLITRDEEKFLQNCLNSIQELVDEIIVVDTGSIDQTKEVAKRFTDKIYDFPWCNDFSLARNESLKYATKNWILILDADETILESEHQKIKELIQNNKLAGYQLLQRNYTNNHAKFGFKFNSAANPEAHQFLGRFDSWIVRLFPNNKQIHFQGTVHESVDRSIQELGGKILPAEIIIHHYGEEKGAAINQDKINTYFQLCQKKVQDEPQNPRAHYELGVLYKELKQFALSEAELHKSLSLDPQPITTLLELAVVQQKQQHFTSAISTFQQVLEKNNTLADAYFGLGYCFYQQKEFLKALENFQKAIANNTQFLDAYINLAGVYERLDNFPAASLWLQRAFRLNPHEPRLFYNLAVVHERTSDPQAALKCYQKALELNYSNKTLLQERIIKLEQFVKDNKI